MIAQLLILLTIALVCVVAAGLIPALIYWNRLQAGSAAMRQVQKEYGGELSRQGPFRFPRLQFQHRGVPVRLSFRKSSRKPAEFVVRIAAPCTDADFRLSLVPESAITGAQKMLGMQDFEVGVPSFDRQFFLKTNDDSKLKQNLDASAQSAFVDLLNLGRVNHFSFNLAAGIAVLEKSVAVDEYRQVAGLLDAFLRSYDAITNVVDADVELIATSFSGKQPVCLVCGDKITARRVSCRSCHTPHHKECWEFVGKCSTYACGQRKYTRKNSQRLRSHDWT